MESRLLFGILLLLPSLLSAKKVIQYFKSFDLFVKLILKKFFLQDGDYIDGFSCGGKPLKDMFPDLNKNGTLGDQVGNEAIND